jgi:hypothetical protein
VNPSSRVTAWLRVVQALITAWAIFFPNPTVLRAVGAVVAVFVVEILGRIVAADDPLWAKLVRASAFLIGLRALTNLVKPLIEGSAFVFFGALLHGPLAMALAVAVGVFMLVYAWSAWHRRRRAVALGIAYAGFVAVNVLLFAVLNHVPNEPRYVIGGLVFAILGIGITAGTAYLLHSHREELT